MTRLIMKATEKGPRAQPASEFDTDSFEIGIDNRCSKCISHRKRDFVGELVPTRTRVSGYTGTTTRTLYEGTLQWSVEDDQGRATTFLIPGSVYDPEGSHRLLSPQHWSQTQQHLDPMHHGTHESTFHDEVVLYWKSKTRTRTISLDSANVGTIRSAPGYHAYKAYENKLETLIDTPLYCQPANAISDDEGSDDEGSAADNGESESSDGVEAGDGEPQTFVLDGPEGPTTVPPEEDQCTVGDLASEYLQWHYRLGHAPMKAIKALAKLGVLPRRLAQCEAPLCPSCLYGKAKKRQWRGKPKSNGATDSSRVATQPGECVSVDQMISHTPGLIAQLRGIPTIKRYKCVTTFVDQYTRYGYTHVQMSTSGDETVDAKEAFETHLQTMGVRVQQYQADNGIFADGKFMEACKKNGQRITFCGVNAHFQNGMAERRIQSLTGMCRTMLVHAQRRWPTAISANLWPYAYRHANNVFNHLPSDQDPERKGRSPYQRISGSEVDLNPKHWMPFGCPTYALDSKLQEGKHLNKWKERSRVGVYLGLSPNHARNVALVLSLQTGLASPQFHVVFDQHFRTMSKRFGNGVPKSHWQKRCHFTDASEQVPTPESVEYPANQPRRTKESDEDVEVNFGEPSESQQPVDDDRPAEQREQEEPEAQGAEAPTAPPVEYSRFGRRRTRTERFIEVSQAKMESTIPRFVAFEALLPLGMGEQEVETLTALKATSDPDTMYYHEAMKEPDRAEFIKAMAKEVKDQMANGNFEYCKRSDVPKGAQVIPAVWALKRKRRIQTQEVYKWKARFNIDGSKQVKGVSYWETYAPVASWSLIRLVLTTAIINNWHSQQIDYVQAYPQATAETDNLYVEVPKGFEVKGVRDPREWVLHMKKNVYGGKAAGRVWNQHLVKKLKQAGFTQSEFDECLFYFKSAIYVLYTDDSILTGPKQGDIDEALTKMAGIGLDITDEGEVGDFLGVRIDKRSDGSTELSQPHLIDSILKDLRLDGDKVSTKHTPAAPNKLLRRHSSADHFDQSFDYRSVVGKLMYLSTTRLDCAFAINQCARFCSDPKKEHGDAVRYLGRYLAGTRENGLILKPDKSKGFDVFVDADFCGAWDPTESEDPDTVRSRSGYCITYAGCPIYWSSKLQTEITMSSTESEYIALSESLRSVIPMMRMVKEMKRFNISLSSEVPKIHCKVFEDNSGALEMATVHKFRPRTKHLGTKWHFFRSFVTSGAKGGDMGISIHKISTELQPADTLTKPLSRELFERHRITLMGW